MGCQLIYSGVRITRSVDKVYGCGTSIVLGQKLKEFTWIYRIKIKKVNLRECGLRDRYKGGIEYHFATKVKLKMQ